MTSEFEIWTVRRRKVVVGVQRTASSDGRPLIVSLRVVVSAKRIMRVRDGPD